VLTIVVVLVLALLGAGCGGGDDESAGGDTDTVVTETDGTTTEETTDGDTTDMDSIATEDCAALVAASASLSQAFAAAGGANPDAEEANDLLDEWAENAPDEIRDDIATLAEAYGTYVAALDEVDFQSGETPSADELAQFQGAIASIDEQAVTEASQNLSDWSEENC
jgi:hypothetical protein